MTQSPVLSSEDTAAARRKQGQRARRLTERARTLAGEGRIGEAIACQREVTDLRPADPTAFFRLGMLCREARKVELAVQALRRATELSPADRDPREALTETLAEAGRFEEAVLEARLLLKVVPRSLFARDVLSVSYLQLGRLDKALQVTGEMVRLDPLNPMHHFRRGLLFQQQGNLRASVYAYGRVLEMAHPETGTYNDAEEALDFLDDNQTRQILLLASEDRLFLLKLRRDAVEAVNERGFCLTEDGLDRLNQIIPHEFPEWAADQYLPPSRPGLGLYN